MDKFDEFVENEVLFEKWWDFLCYDRKLLEEDDFMSTWEDAKNIAISVLGSKKARLKFRREITHLRSSMNNPFCNFYMLDFDSVLCCATTMIIISGKKDEFDGILDEFKQVYLSQANEIAKYAADLIERIKAGEIKKDYDYSKVDGSLKDCEDSKSEDVICVDSKIRQTENDDNKKTIEELEQTIKEQKEEISELKKQLAAYEEGPSEEKPHNKVRLELVRQLFNSAGADFNKNGVKANVGKLAEYITGLHLSTCKTYMTFPELNPEYKGYNPKLHKEEREKVNGFLIKTDTNIRL